MLIKKSIYPITLLAWITLSLSACTKPITTMPQEFIPANRAEMKTTNAPTPTVAATFGLGNDPAVVKAYEKFTRTGIAQNIQSKGFETVAYDAFSRPLVACEPLHLCILQLEQGERINNIELGDSAHWLVATSLMGDQRAGSYQVAIKPKLYDAATDLVITTDKRTYNIGLISQQGSSTHVVRFYYPEETVALAIQHAQPSSDSSAMPNAMAESSVVDVNHLNFNYDLSGDNPPWRPVQVFDDGTKTFIRLAPISERLDLPVLYVRRNQQVQLVNYRYRRPYFVVDGLFETAYLMSGNGKHQQRVQIKNRQLG